MKNHKHQYSKSQPIAASNIIGTLCNDLEYGALRLFTVSTLVSTFQKNLPSGVIELYKSTSRYLTPSLYLNSSKT